METNPPKDSRYDSSRTMRHGTVLGIAVLERAAPVLDFLACPSKLVTLQ